MYRTEGLKIHLRTGFPQGGLKTGLPASELGKWPKEAKAEAITKKYITSSAVGNADTRYWSLGLYEQLYR
jgi:hypothetical protein